jgi:hypothetical protein
VVLKEARVVDESEAVRACDTDFHEIQKRIDGERGEDE